MFPLRQMFWLAKYMNKQAGEQIWLHYGPELLLLKTETKRDIHGGFYTKWVSQVSTFLNALLNLVRTIAQQSPSQQSTCVLSLMKRNRPSNMDILPNNDFETFVSRSTVKVTISRIGLHRKSKLMRPLTSATQSPSKVLGCQGRHFPTHHHCANSVFPMTNALAFFSKSVVNHKLFSAVVGFQESGSSDIFPCGYNFS